MSKEPSFAEKLDAAKDGTEFTQVLQELFTVLAQARDEEEGE